MFSRILRPSTVHQGIRHAAHFRVGSRFPIETRTCQQAHQTRIYLTGPRYGYQRYQQGQGFLYRWAAKPTFWRDIGILTAGATGFYVYNLEEVPVSGRRRFNIISPEFEKQISEMGNEGIRQEFKGKILPRNHPATMRVERVLRRLLPNSGLSEDGWEVNVINEDIPNAFVIPGGKVFVFSGLFKLCRTDDDIAAVLGHEIAHNVAHHAAEKMSQSAVITLPLTLGLMFFIQDFYFSKILIDLVLSKPNGRKQESEADYIGLLMMAKSCYDPAAAARFWQVMEKIPGTQAPVFMSTHPSHHDRFEKIHEWMPEAKAAFEDAGCQLTSSRARAFSTWRTSLV